MYRDASPQPAHDRAADRAIGAIQLAEGLIASCAGAVARLNESARAERWIAARELHEDYPEIWRQLDGARATLVASGANTLGYDELRAGAAPVLPALSFADRGRELDPGALDDARRAAAELRLAMPAIDWTAVDARVHAAASTRLAPRRHRTAVIAVLLVLGLAIATWVVAMIPEQRPNRDAELRRELAEIVTDRRDRIADLRLIIGDRCDRQNVHELMRLLVMDGRWYEARPYADGYEARCGEDPVVRKWADAPRPRPRS